MKTHEFLKRTPKIVVPFTDAASTAVINAAKKKGMDIAELRIDLYSKHEIKHVLTQTEKFKKIPTIATIRSRKEGGAWDLSEQTRLSLFTAVLPKVSAIDIELSSKKILKDVIKVAHAARKLVIVSFHDFKKMPSQNVLLRIIREAKSAGADIVKIAAMARNAGDMCVLAAVTLREAEQNLITIAMGREGTVSRIFFPALGSLMTYACLGKAVAPGQLSLEKTCKSLKFFYSA